MKIETILFEQTIEKQNQPKFSLPGYSLFRLSTEEIGRLHEIWPVNLRDMRARLKRGDFCYVVADDRRLIHYSWIQITGLHYIGPARKSVRVNENEMWIYHCRTVDQARGKGIYPAVLRGIISEASETNIRHAWIYTTSTNTASQKGIYKAGFTPKAVLYSLKFGEIIIPWMKL